MEGSWAAERASIIRASMIELGLLGVPVLILLFPSLYCVETICSQKAKKLNGKVVPALRWRFTFSGLNFGLIIPDATCSAY